MEEIFLTWLSDLIGGITGITTEDVIGRNKSAPVFFHRAALVVLSYDLGFTINQICSFIKRDKTTFYYYLKRSEIDKEIINIIKTLKNEI